MDDSTSSGSHTELEQDQGSDPGCCSVCGSEIGFGLLLPKRTHWYPPYSKFCRKLVCADCSKDRAFNAVKGKDQRICKSCLTHMLSQFYVPEEDGNEDSSVSLLQQLQTLNTALREERAKRISLEDEIDSFQVGRDYSESLPELMSQLETMKKQAEAFAMQREEMEKRLEGERKKRELEENRLIKAQKKLKIIKQKLGQALAGLIPDVSK